MKKSLFKRAFASAIAAPLALSSLTSALAAPGDEADKASKVFNIRDLIYVAPDAEIVDGVQQSQWNEVVGAQLDNVKSFVREIDPSTAFAFVTTYAGTYSDAVKDILDKADNLTLTYDDITQVFLLEGDIQDVEALLTGTGVQKIDDYILSQADKFTCMESLTPLNNIDLSSLKTDFEVKISVDASGLLAGSKSVPVSYDIITEDGNYTIYGENGVYSYALDKIEEFKSVLADNVCCDEHGGFIMEKLASYEATAKAYALKRIDRYDNSYTKTFDNADDALAFAKTKAEAAKARYEKGLANAGLMDNIPASVLDAFYKNYAKIPGSVDAFAASALVQENFTKLVNWLNSFGLPVEGSVEDIATILNNATNINVSYDKGDISITADFPDEEIAAVAAHVATLGEELISSYKVIELKIDGYNAVTGGSGDVYFNVKRIIETVPIEIVTTTTTATTTDIDTTTTTDVNATTTTDVNATTTTDVNATTTTDVNATTTSDVNATTTTDVNATTTTDVNATTTADVNATTTTAATTTDVNATTTTDVNATTTTDVNATTTAATTSDIGGTTTTVSVTTPAIVGFEVIEFEPLPYSLYFAENNEGFDRDQVTALVVKFLYEDGSFEIVDFLAEGETRTFDFGGATPYSTFVDDGVNLNHKYNVKVCFEGAPLTWPNGDELEILALIGRKGDFNLDNAVDSGDSSNVLAVYASVSVGEEYVYDIDYIKDDVLLQELSYFLADIYPGESDVPESVRCRATRALEASEASAILGFYAIYSNTVSPTLEDVIGIWNQFTVN